LPKRHPTRILPSMARVRSLGLVALGALAALLLVAGASAASALFGGADVETLETPELSFDYPAEWRPIEGVEFPLAQAAGEGQVGENTVGLDPDNWVTAFSNDSGIVISAANIDQFVAQARPFYAAVARRTGARLIAEPYRVREAGLPGMRYRMAITSVRGTKVEDEVTMLFRGRTNYVVNCQSARARATEMTAGCGRVFDSFAAKR
jgi:hypothetical protein